jgi:hypothetical protein
MSRRKKTNGRITALKPKDFNCTICRTEPWIVTFTGNETGGKPVRFCKNCWQPFYLKHRRTW